MDAGGAAPPFFSVYFPFSLYIPGQLFLFQTATAQKNCRDTFFPAQDWP
jgi:hypothetical protein